MKILILGGNRFFGKKLARQLISDGHELTLLNRGNLDDGLGTYVERLKCDRKDSVALAYTVAGRKWDVIYDQVCFEAPDAINACKIFTDKTSHYIFTSSQSVYDLGKSLTESAFDPYQYSYLKMVKVEENYAEAKKQCEVEFFKQNRMSVTAVRFPLIIGPDDYTNRFKFHLSRVMNSSPIYFPNPEARHCFLLSDQAASALRFLIDKNINGPLNIASPEPISMKDFVLQIGVETGHQPIFADEPGDENQSPYGLDDDWYLNTQKLNSMGFEIPGIFKWLPDMIRSCVL